MTFEKDSEALLQAPVIRVLEDVLFATGSTFSARRVFNAPVPRTGQVTCYDTTGFTVDCAGTGQDGDLQKGAAWPDPRFTNQGDGTVRDNLTNLVWMVRGETASSSPVPLPATGQTHSLRAGDDGSLHKGTVIPGDTQKQASLLSGLFVALPLRNKGRNLAPAFALPQAAQVYSVYESQ